MGPLADIAVTKHAAARRLLDAAILMFFRDDDSLAVHLVASSCQALVSDLLRARGRRSALEVEAAGSLFLEAKALLEEGELEPNERDTEESLVLKFVASRIRSGEVKEPVDLGIEFSKKEMSELYGIMRKNYNFLKHAHKDPDSHIYEIDVDNYTMLIRTLQTYVLMYSKEAVTPVMRWFALYMIWKEGPPDEDDLFKHVRGMTEAEVIRFLGDIALQLPVE